MASEPTLSALAGQLVTPDAPALYSSPLLRLRGEDGVGAFGDEPADAEPVYSIGGPPGGSSGGGRPGSAYEHLEYAPLVNARVHTLGAQRRIPNAAVARQWRALLSTLVCKAPRDVSAADLQAVAYHLLLADRVDDAQAIFRRVTPPRGSVAAVAAAAATGAPTAPTVSSSLGSTPSSSSTAASWCTLQYDYMAAYLDLCGHAGVDFPVAAAVAAAYAAYPVPKWAARFAELAQQLGEAAGGGSGSAGRRARPAATDEGTPGVAAELDREAAVSRSAGAAASLSMRVEGASIILTHVHVPRVTLSLFCMDLEVLFSTSPFLVASSGVGRGGGAATAGQFTYVRPSAQFTLTLEASTSSGGEHVFPLPAGLSGENLMVSAASVGTPTVLRAAAPFYSARMRVAFSQPDGRLRVVEAASGAPLRRVYCKVYWRESEGGQPRFYKDGYTDVRGSFDYSSLSTDELSRTQQFAVLVLSEGHGALARQVAPPKV